LPSLELTVSPPFFWFQSSAKSLYPPSSNGRQKTAGAKWRINKPATPLELDIRGVERGAPLLPVFQFAVSQQVDPANKWPGSKELLLKTWLLQRMLAV